MKTRFSFKKSASSVLLASILIAPFSAWAANDIVISSGVNGGMYQEYANNVAKVLKSKGHPNVTVINSLGSGENLKRLSTNEANIAFATLDAYSMYLKKGGSELTILSTLKDECGYLVAKKGSSISSEDDFQHPGKKIAIGEEGSGSAVMWSYMATLEPGYKNSTIVFSGGTMILNSLNLPNGPDALLFVTTKDNKTHKLIQAVNAKGSELRFLDIDDRNLSDKLPNGNPVYTFETSQVCDKFFGCTVKTICTKGAIFVQQNNKELNSAFEDISDVLAISKSTIIGDDSK